MFALEPDASKIAFARVVLFLAGLDIELIDCQQDTLHMHRFGSEPIPFTEFQATLQRLNALPLKEALGARVVGGTLE